MAYQLAKLVTSDGQTIISDEQLQQRIERLVRAEAPRLRWLWAYYRNPIWPGLGGAGYTSTRPYRQAQEWGLPMRITGVRAGSEPLSSRAPTAEVKPKEVVIENDIGWRIEMLVMYFSDYGNMTGGEVCRKETAAAYNEAQYARVVARHQLLTGGTCGPAIGGLACS